MFISIIIALISLFQNPAIPTRSQELVLDLKIIEVSEDFSSAMRRTVLPYVDYWFKKSEPRLFVVKPYEEYIMIFSLEYTSLPDIYVNRNLTSTTVIDGYDFLFYSDVEELFCTKKTGSKTFKFQTDDRMYFSVVEWYFTIVDDSLTEYLVPPVPNQVYDDINNKNSL